MAVKKTSGNRGSDAHKADARKAMQRIEKSHKELHLNITSLKKSLTALTFFQNMSQCAKSGSGRKGPGK